MLRFVCPLIVVENIGVSRRFYEAYLDQKVRYDFGVDIQFEGDFSIHQKAHFLDLLGDGGGERFPVTLRSHAAELYFETDTIEDVWSRLKQAGVRFIHDLQEQPWGQRVMRLYDPDGHIIEIGEALEAVVARFHAVGMSIFDITQKTGMPQTFVEGVVQKQVK